MGGFLEASDDERPWSNAVGRPSCNNDSCTERVAESARSLTYQYDPRLRIVAGVACTLRKREVAPIGFTVKRLESDSTVRKVSDTPRKVRGRRRKFTLSFYQIAAMRITDSEAWRVECPLMT
jgi:hypothetical protein